MFIKEIIIKTSFFILLKIIVNMDSGCGLIPSQRTPIANPPSLYSEDKIPLRVAVIFSKEFEVYRYRAQGGGVAPDFINIGASSVELFKNGLPIIFKEVEFVQENSELGI